MNQDKLEMEIEDIDLHDKTEEEIQRVISALSPEGMKLRRERKDVRYKLYRLKGEAEGRCASVADEDFKKIFESQTLFDGWKNFSQSWDVAMDNPYRIVHRVRSVQAEWDELVDAKFPKILPGGKITYPDINVRKKVEAEAKLQEEAKKNEK